MEISDPVRVESMRKVVQLLERNGAPWNERYIATTVEGQVYSGRLAGRAGSDFFMQSDRSHLLVLIGHTDDLDEDAVSGDEIAFTATRFGSP